MFIIDAQNSSTLQHLYIITGANTHKYTVWMIVADPAGKQPNIFFMRKQYDTKKIVILQLGGL